MTLTPSKEDGTMTTNTCSTCGRAANDPRTHGEGPRREVCADELHLQHYSDADLKLLEGRYRSHYSQLATKARGHNTPSARRAQEACEQYKPFQAEAVRRHREREQHSELCAWRFGMNAKCDCKAEGQA